MGVTPQVDADNRILLTRSTEFPLLLLLHMYREPAFVGFLAIGFPYMPPSCQTL